MHRSVERKMPTGFRGMEELSDLKKTKQNKVSVQQFSARAGPWGYVGAVVLKLRYFIYFA